uniref:Sugar phosphate transporter domain-containing protein n=1 Tax=Chromera velia CCMP2878 TaxID=1169474 RepID=A0A0G4I113_9ALVE|eukprot:Cvel_3.t1-p1 / transcript=Cvel_3.t1 / gene=Cvel_3 / organism=Chromera_velia_CCMP2878 / gene_product=Probable sugar phosphate/phosphate translocator, putative / transcript_product=Probable sugar phosphate/phosphate translocator, putative / location=Cvel_scaffold5:11215-16299(+) / protein_length=380 / sequence_SO=supercontig / SO=protein_coding / is_pseudo=false
MMTDKIVKVLQITGALVLWFAASMSLTAANKYLFDTMGFHYPILVTFIHTGFMSVMASMILIICPCGSDYPVVETRKYFCYIVPIATCAVTEIALSNEAYTMVSISVMTVIKSCILVVTYLVALCMGLERFRCTIFCLVCWILGAISLTVPEMEVHSFWGVVYLMIAVFLASLRWVLVHRELKVDRHSPLQLMLLTQPIGALLLAGPAFFIDVGPLSQDFDLFVDRQRQFYVVLMVTGCILLAFLLIFAEYRLVGLTSSTSLAVAGTGKEILTIFMSIEAFKERINLAAGFGIGLSIIGILLYIFERSRLAAIEEEQRPAPPTGLSPSRCRPTPIGKETLGGWREEIGALPPPARTMKQPSKPADDGRKMKIASAAPAPR